MGIENYKFLNGEDYICKKWKRGQFFQITAIKRTLNSIKNTVVNNGLSVYFHGKTLFFNCLKSSDLRVKCKFSLLSDYISGEHDPDTGEILLNEKIRTNGAFVFGTLCHEYSHEIQQALVRHINEYSKDSIEYQYLMLLKNEVLHKENKFESFGISFNGDGYVSTSNVMSFWSNNNNLPESFYALQVSERTAFSTGVDAYNYIVYLDSNYKDIEKYEPYNSKQEKASDEIRNVYGARGLTYNEICLLYDTAKLNLIFDNPPEVENDIMASLMYDMIVMLKLQSEYKTEDNFDEKRQEFLEMMRNKEFLLNTFYADMGKRFVSPNLGARFDGYEIINEYEIKSNELITQFKLSRIDTEVLKRNPKIIVLFVLQNEDKHVNFPPNVDLKAFEEWFYSKSNKERLVTKEILSIAIWGIEYSQAIWEKKVLEQENAFLDKHKEYKETSHNKENYDNSSFIFGQHVWVPLSNDQAQQLNNKNELDLNI